MKMKKSLLAVAFASVFAAPAAMAEATAYGVMHLSYDRVNDGASTNASKTNQLNSNRSHLGFRGSESIGGDMSAIWQIESLISVDDAGIDTNDDGVDDTGNTLATRNTYLGLKSDSMGTLKAGKHDTPYKMATRNLDVFKETSADNRSLMGGGHDARLSNILLYTSPSMGGFSVAAATVFGAESATSGDTKGSAFSVAGMFDMGGIVPSV